MDNIILKQGDCLNLLKEIKSNSIDLILIDPPYEISRNSNFAAGLPSGKDTDRFRVTMDFGEWDNTEFNLSEALKESYRVLRKGGTIICFYDLWKITILKEVLEKAKFKQLRFIEWVKTNPVPLNSKTNYLTNAREIAVVAVKGGKPTFNSEYDNGIYDKKDFESNVSEGEIYYFPICHDKGRFHPTQKPLELIEQLILKHSSEGDTVVDFVMGSGTTGVGAVKHNRKFIGGELNTEYFKKARQRIYEAIKEQ